MPAKKQYTAEFKEQAVRFVLEETGPDRVGEVSVDARWSTIQRIRRTPTLPGEGQGITK